MQPPLSIYIYIHIRMYISVVVSLFKNDKQRDNSWREGSYYSLLSCRKFGNKLTCQNQLKRPFATPAMKAPAMPTSALFLVEGVLCFFFCLSDVVWVGFEESWDPRRSTKFLRFLRVGVSKWRTCRMFPQASLPQTEYSSCAIFFNF